jgi:hypothetical protein
MSSKLNRHLRQNELVCAGSYPHPGTKQWWFKKGADYVFDLKTLFNIMTMLLFR